MIKLSITISLFIHKHMASLSNVTLTFVTINVCIFCITSRFEKWEKIS